MQSFGRLQGHIVFTIKKPIFHHILLYLRIMYHRHACGVFKTLFAQYGSIWFMCSTLFRVYSIMFICSTTKMTFYIKILHSIICIIMNVTNILLWILLLLYYHIRILEFTMLAKYV